MPSSLDENYGYSDNDLTVEPNAGVLIAGAAGYNLPLGTMNFRMEGELAARLNSVDEIDDNLGNVAELDDADVSSIAGMANAYLDVYVVRNFALTVGAGLGYTRVTADLALIDDSASGFAFQGRAGARYNLGPNSVISLGYTYFAAPGLELDVEVDDEDINSEFDYTNHGFHLGYAFNF
jgi:opacity protein-like surface antigen